MTKRQIQQQEYLQETLYYDDNWYNNLFAEDSINPIIKNMQISLLSILDSNSLYEAKQVAKKALQSIRDK